MRFTKHRVSASALRRIRYWITSVFFILAAVILIILSLVNPTATGHLRQGALHVLAPAIEIITTPIQSTKNAWQWAKDMTRLRQTNTALQAENAALKAWYLHAQSLQGENDSLRALLKVKNTLKPQSVSINTLATSILNDTSTEFAKSLLIRAGRKDGVNKNAVVLSEHGLLGRVIDSADHTARVLLITDINTRVPVLIAGKGQTIHAIMAGQNNALPILTHIATPTQKTTLTQLSGAHIVTSGTGDLFPYGIPVGTLQLAQDGAFTVRPYMESGTFLFAQILL